MSSFFRSANDVTSSTEDTSDQSSSNNDEEEEDQPDLLGRITTLSSDTEVRDIVRSTGDNQTLSPYQERASWLPPGDAAGHQSFLLHALLEERCVNQALDHVNRRSEAARHYTRDDVEVQQQARQLYDDLCQHLIPKGLLPQGPEQDHFRGHRQGYRQGLNLLSRGLSHDGRASALSRTGSSLALPPALQSVFEGASSPPDPPVAPALLTHNIPPLLTSDFQQLHVQDTRDMPSPIDTVTSHQVLDMSRYGNDFAEMNRIGKGGYGEVFAVRHKISGVEYAIKKIPVSGLRLRKIRERGQAELDALLNELRVLARLDHPNIVRYYNGWLETSAGGPVSGGRHQANAGAQKLLLLDREHDFEFSTPSSRELHLETRKGSIDIVFEHSGAGVDPLVHFEDSVSAADDPEIPQARQRRETFSSTTSRKSTTTKASVEDEDGNDIVDIPRDSTYADSIDQPSSVDQSSTGAMMSDLTGSMQTRTPSVLTLHLQMSLHPLTLGDFIAHKGEELQPLAESKQKPYNSLQHCFHTMISIIVMLSLLDGVEYLHNEGLVHRDLKPANIFITPSLRPIYASIDPCQHCPTSEPLHLNVRIGDFGLVTSVADPEHELDKTPRKAVGTQHYRPPPSSATAYAPGDARVDIYALGIIFFELLWPFQTRMERHDALDKLKNGALPSGFEDHVGDGGQSIGECIRAMLDPTSIMSCMAVRGRLRKILDQIKS